MTKKIVSLIIGMLCLVSFGSSYSYKVNQASPAFSLPDTSGKTHSLKKYRGKIVVLEWLNYGCPYVKKHYDSNNMQTLQKKYTAKGIVWLAIVSSAPGKQGYYKARKMAKISRQKKSHASAILLDSTGRVGRKYRAKTTPHMYIINKKGKLVYNGAIDSIKSTDQDDIAKAENYVAKALDAILANKAIAKSTTVPYGCSVKYN